MEREPRDRLAALRAELKRAFPIQPVPADMLDMARRLGVGR